MIDVDEKVGIARKNWYDTDCKGLSANVIKEAYERGFNRAYRLMKPKEPSKAQEPIEARLHLCDSCTKLYPECDATADGIEFGCGVGNDNIIGCTAYENRWKAQEPRVMTLEEADKAQYVWLESDQGGLGVRRVEIDPEDSRTVYVMSFGLRTTIHEVRTFKRHFRCWSEKPSDELRKETPWTQTNGL